MHVLIVEDDRTIAENLYDFLEARGHQCDFANTLAGARALLAGSRFDALALDRNLPDGDGATLARSLRDAGQTLPILMLTARDQLDDKLDGFAAGADDYLVKPFALKEVEVRLLALHLASAFALGLRLVVTTGPHQPAPDTTTDQQQQHDADDQQFGFAPVGFELQLFFFGHGFRLRLVIKICCLS